MLSVRKDVRAVRERDGPLRALLDEQDREPTVADRRERLEDDVDDARRQAERGLVEQQHLGVRDERPRDRELLLLAARERAGLAAEGLLARPGRARRRAARSSSMPSRAAPACETQLEVFLDGQVREDPPSLRHECDAAPRDVLGPLARRPTRPLTRTSPRVGRTAPMIACSVDDLPAPFGPIRPTISPRSTSRERPRTARDRTVAYLEVLDGQQRDAQLARPRRGRRSRRDRPRRRRGWRGSPPGVPSASDASLVEHVDPIADPHDQRHVVVDQQDAGFVLVTQRRAPPPRSSGTSASGKPAAGSSSRTKRGLRRKRARDAEPPLVALRERVGAAPRPARRARASRAARLPAPAPRAAPRRRRARPPRRSRARRASGMRGCAGRSAPARAGPGGSGSSRVTSRPSSSTAPGRRTVEAAEDVHERRLAGAVRADQPDDLCRGRARV